jgi:hypothetical protein
MGGGHGRTWAHGKQPWWLAREGKEGAGEREEAVHGRGVAWEVPWGGGVVGAARGREMKKKRKEKKRKNMEKISNLKISEK